MISCSNGDASIAQNGAWSKSSSAILRDDNGKSNVELDGLKSQNVPNNIGRNNNISPFPQDKERENPTLKQKAISYLCADKTLTLSISD